jgi:hypothetical protein
MTFFKNGIVHDVTSIWNHYHYFLIPIFGLFVIIDFFYVIYNFEISDKIIILKRVKSLRQFRHREKELVRLN